MADLTTQQSIVRESPEIEAYKLDLLRNARGLAFNTDANGNPLDPSQSLAAQLPAYQVAGFSPAQQAALNAAQQTGIGSYGNYLNSANAALNSGYQTTAEAADVLRGSDTRGQFANAQQNTNAGISALGNMQNLAAQSSAANLQPSNQLLSAAAQRTADMGQSTAGIQAGIGTLANSMQGYNPNSAQAFMDPYKQQVIDRTMAEMDRQAQIAQQGASANAVRAGAFGGSREGIQRAEMQRNLMDQKSNTIANLLSQGYTQSQAQAQQAFEQQQQRGIQAGTGIGSLSTQQGQLGLQGAGQLANIGQTMGQQSLQQAQLGQGAAGLMGQAAGQYGNLAGQQGALAAQQFGIGQQMASGLGSLGAQAGQFGINQAALGQTAQGMNQSDINFLYNTGQSQQALNQQGLDAARATKLQQAYAPYQQVGFLSDVYKGAPSTQMSTAVASQPTASPFQQAVGIGLGTVATAAGAKKAGLFGP